MAETDCVWFTGRAHTKSGWIRLEGVLDIRLEQTRLYAGDLVDCGPSLLLPSKLVPQNCQGAQGAEAFTAAANDTHGVLYSSSSQLECPEGETWESLYNMCPRHPAGDLHGSLHLQVKALKTLRSILHLLVAIQRSIGAMLNIVMLVLVVFFTFAYSGVLLFGSIKQGCDLYNANIHSNRINCACL